MLLMLVYEDDDTEMDDIYEINNIALDAAMGTKNPDMIKAVTSGIHDDTFLATYESYGNEKIALASYDGGISGLVGERICRC